MKNQCFDSFGRVIRDYFQGFKRGLHGKDLYFLLSFLGLGIMAASGVGADRIHKDGIFINWMTGIPVLYALASGALHRVSLPFMVYLIPCSRKQRERYIQRMLVVKVAVPVAFGAVCDVAAVCMGTFSPYVFVLQMAGVFFLSSLYGMLHEDNVYMAETKSAYGGLRPFVTALLIGGSLAGTALFVICAGAVSRMEFRVVLSVCALVMLPILAAVGKRWKQIRKNFADYEMAAETVE